MSQPLIQLDYHDLGYSAVCEGTDCGNRFPVYRLARGAMPYMFFCEQCMILALIGLQPPHRELYDGSGYMNPNGEF